MLLTYTPNPVPYDQAFDAIKTAIDAMPTGVKLFINSGEFTTVYLLGPRTNNTFHISVGDFYGYDRPSANLDLLAAFYEEHPEYADRTFLSVKGGSSGDEESLRRSVDNINELLRGAKKLDLFECARVDPTIPVETTMKTLGKLIEEGKFSYIGMSEANGTTLRRAHAVSIMLCRLFDCSSSEGVGSSHRCCGDRT